MSQKTIKSKVNNTHFGEIIQGIFKDVSKSKCAISFPISINLDQIKKYKKKNYFNDNFKFSNAVCESSYEKNNNFSLEPDSYHKSKLLVNKIVKKYKIRNINGKIKIKNTIPVCRGLGSSTASLVSLLMLIKKKFKLKISRKKILELCASIEPTDPILIKEICLFSTKKGIVKKKFKFKIPKSIIYGIDTDIKGRGVNTVKMKDINYKKKDSIFFMESYNKLKNKNSYDKVLLKKISLESLKINQKYYPKKKFEEILKIEKQLSHDFIIGAHSGTMVGFVYSYNKKNGQRFKKKDLSLIKGLSKIYKAPIVKYFHV